MTKLPHPYKNQETVIPADYAIIQNYFTYIAPWMMTLATSFVDRRPCFSVTSATAPILYRVDWLNARKCLRDVIDVFFEFSHDGDVRISPDNNVQVRRGDGPIVDIIVRNIQSFESEGKFSRGRGILQWILGNRQQIGTMVTKRITNPEFRTPNSYVLELFATSG